MMKSIMLALSILSIYSCSYLNNPFLPDSFRSSTTLSPAGVGNISVSGDLNFAEVINISTSDVRRVFITKSSSQSTSWTATPSQSWIVLSPASGTLVNSSYFDVSINASGLSNAVYNETITVTSAEGTVIPSSIPVTVSSVRANNNTAGITWITINNLGEKIRWSIPSQVPSGISKITVYYKSSSGPIGLRFIENGTIYYNSSLVSTGGNIGVFVDQGGFRNKSGYFQLEFDNGSALDLDIWKIRYYTNSGVSGEVMASAGITP